MSNIFFLFIQPRPHPIFYNERLNFPFLLVIPSLEHLKQTSWAPRQKTPPWNFRNFSSLSTAKDVEASSGVKDKKGEKGVVLRIHLTGRGLRYTLLKGPGVS